MQAEEFDTKFENSADITGFLDLSQAHRPGYEQTRVNIDFPSFCQVTYKLKD